MITVAEIQNIAAEAHAAAADAADRFFQDRLGGVDRYACGFAWINLYNYQGTPLRGNSKVGRALKQAGIRQNYNRVFEIWNPSKFPCQNVDTLEAGAAAAAAVWRKHGFAASAGSRLD